MESRVDKYKDTMLDNEVPKSRASKNQGLYHSISNEELDGITIKTNASILTSDVQNINISQVRDMLDKKYRDDYDRKTLNIPEKSSIEDIEYEKTREYDINQILDQARNNNKNDNYNEERLKKLRDTQFDILNNLSLKKDDITAPADEASSMGLMELINTITEKELATTEIDPLDIFSDLKGNDDTKIINTEKITEELNVPEIDTTENLERFTDSIEFNKNDFADFNDIAGTKSNKILTIILLGLLAIGFIAGLVVLLNYVLGWGLF